MPTTKCFKCNRPRRGHTGPTDDLCTLEIAGPGAGHGTMTDLSFDSELDDLNKLGEAGGGNDPPPGPLKKSTPRKKSDAAFAMKEILVQLGNLTCSVQRITDDNKALAEGQKKQQLELKHCQNATSVVRLNPVAQTGSRPLVPPAYNPASFIAPVENNGAQVAGAPASSLQGTINPGLDPSIPLPNGARVSKKTFLSARAGEYVNLSEFAPNSEPSSVMESVIDEATGNLIFKAKSVKKAIDSFFSWSRAWAGYESLLITMTPALYQPLCDYRLFIQSCDAIYQWPAVTSYDQRHRHRTSMTNSVDFNSCSTDIYVSTLNANTIRPNPKTCYACGSIDHNMRDCPFQRQSSKQYQPPKKNSNYSNPQVPRPNPNQSFIPRTDTQAYAESKPVICFNFNNGRCNSPACWRLHQCSGCGGPEPRITCARCASAKG
jgi:hypothetical protein